MCRVLAHVLPHLMGCFVRLLLSVSSAISLVDFPATLDLFLVPRLVLCQSPVGLVPCPGPVGRLLARSLRPLVLPVPVFPRQLESVLSPAVEFLQPLEPVLSPVAPDSTGSSSVSSSVVPRRIFCTKSTGSCSGLHTLNFIGFCTTGPFSTGSFARLAFLAGFSFPFPASSGFRLDCPSSGCDSSSGFHPGVCFSRSWRLFVAFFGVVS